MGENARASIESCDVGNAAKLREALVLALFLLDLKEGVPYKTVSQKDIDFMKAAVAAPPRNCDVGTAEEQYERYKSRCMSQDCCDCPVREQWDFGQTGSESCQLVWAQMPYEEKSK